MQTRSDDDLSLFTTTVLLISSVSAIARDELDKLIIARTNHDQDVGELLRARSGVAALATISQHYEGGC